MKPADAIVVGHGDHIPYPPGTKELHHEVELVVALGSDAPAGELPVAQAERLIYGYGVGLDLTRRDLQAAAKARACRGISRRASITPHRSASWCMPAKSARWRR